jgi:ribosome-interacting GTPase 1
MMEWEDARVQLIDLPPITADYMEGYISSMVRVADAALLMVDLGDDDGPFGAEAVLERLAQTKTVLVGQQALGAGLLTLKNPDPTVQHVKTLLIANKTDLPGAVERLEVVRELFGQRFAMHAIAAEHGTGLEDLRTSIYRFLNVIRVYTKQPGKPPDLTSPFTCPVGSTLVEMAALVHRDFADGLKSARIWGTGVYDGQTVKRDHMLHDKDIVELHV